MQRNMNYVLQNQTSIFLFSVKQKLVSNFTWVYWQHKGKQKFSDRVISLQREGTTGRQNSFCCE